jgi:hypothetical protein
VDGGAWIEGFPREYVQVSCTYSRKASGCGRGDAIASGGGGGGVITSGDGAGGEVRYTSSWGAAGGRRQGAVEAHPLPGVVDVAPAH